MNPSSTSEKEIPTTLRTWLQTILRYNHVKLHVIERIRKEDIQKILHILSALLSDEHTKNVSFELCQQLLFNEEFINLFSVSFESVFELSLISFLSMTQTQNQHHDNHNQVKAENRQILSSLDRPDSISINTQKHRQHLLKSLIKSILSSFLIAKFPNDILNSTESPRSEGVEVDYSQLKLKSGECYFAAKLLLKHLYRLFAYILGWYKEGPRVYWPPWIKLMNFQRFYHNNVFALQHYLVAFHEWRKLDSLLLINSLELTFQQSYHQYLLIRRDLEIIRSHGGDLLSSVSLLSGSEGQLEKIQDMLKRILGPKKAVSRIEEIKATVEALNSQLNLSEDQVPIPSFPQNILESINQQAVTQIMNYSQAPLSEDSINSVALKQLEMLSRLAGLENERIAYEITYDKNYRLPVKNLVTASVEGENKSEDKSIAGYLKQTLLKRIADQLINSLRKSNIQSIEQLAEGMVVPVLVSEHSPSVNGQEIKLAIYLSAKILQLYPPNEVVGPVIDAEFLVDGQVERNVSFERVKIASKANNAYLLIQSLYDVIRQVTLLIPNRKDLQMNLLKCFDEELISQMVEQDSLSSTDILPIFSYIYEFVQSLQAEYRLEYSKQWLADFIQACDESVSEEIRSANPIVQQSLERLIPLTYVNGEIDRSTVSKVLPFIPLFFERISEIVEEIQADMANYYISLLVPVLHKHGYQLLLQRFQQRLQVGNTSVHVLSAMIHVQFASEDNWNRTLNELIEAELFHTQEAITPSTMYNSITTNPEVVKSVAARVFLDVLQIPFRLDSIHVVQQRVLPETLYFDTKRLSLIRDLIDKIVLENSLLVTMKQLLSQKYKIMLSENEESEFIHRVDVLLSQQDLSQSFIYTECLRFAQSLIFVREQHQQHNHSLRSIAVEEHVQPRVLESDLGELLERSISDVVKEGNPVLQLFQKRIYKLLFRVILEKPHQLKLRQYSLQAKGLERNLHQLFNLSKALFRHNLRVYFPVYQIVLSTCLEKLIV